MAVTLRSGQTCYSRFVVGDVDGDSRSPYVEEVYDEVATPLEGAVFGQERVTAIRDRLNGYLARYLGTEIAEVLFRAGRIDAVWGVRTADERRVVIKAHRPPTDLPSLAASVQAQGVLSDVGFPCPTPISGPDRYDNLTLHTESLIVAGQPQSARQPGIRNAIAGGLAHQAQILSSHRDIISRVGPGPAWCRYHDGPWPTPHDPIFDFRNTPPAFAWLDRFAAEATDRLNQMRHGPTLAGHADWYSGNLRFDGERLVATFDWDLFADTEPVIAGISAGSYTASSTSDGGLPTPDEVVAFLVDYDTFRPRPFSAAEQHTAAAAACWAIAYNARCELSMLASRQPAPGSTLELARRHQSQYMNLVW
jgi:hypothetical protein